VQENLAGLPGLRAAHLVGSAAALPDEADLPWYKDIDLHLIFDPEVPAVALRDRFLPVIEAKYKGLMIEAGLKPVSDYASAQVVLANPEIADHLRIDSSIYDPSGLLEALREPVREEFARRRWVRARCEYERGMMRGPLGMLGGAEAAFGPGAPVQIAGYGFSFLVALLCIATLRPPTTGGSAWLRGREILDEWGHPEYYDEWVQAFHLQELTVERVMARLEEAAILFDQAVAVKRSFVPFAFKLDAHLRPYFVETCRSLLAAGYPAEAAGWITPYLLTATTILLLDGPDSGKAQAAAQQASWLNELHLGTPAERAQLVNRLHEIAGKTIALADTIVAQNPAITD
jgi:hypothetical protein